MKRTNAEVVAAMNNLTRNGVTDGGVFHPSDDDLLTIALCRYWICLQKRTMKPVTSAGSSYTLKHLVEADMGRYISNGAFIAAARLEGLVEARVCPTSFNVYVNLSSKRRNITASEFRGIQSLLAEGFPEFNGMDHVGTDQRELLKRMRATSEAA